MRENKLADLSIDFAVRALDFADKIEGHHSLKNQFERSFLPASVLIYGKLIMPRAKLTLCQNYRLRSKNVMKLNIGLSFLLNQKSPQRKMQKTFYTPAASSAEFLLLLSIQ